MVENFEIMKAYVVSVIRVGQDLPHAKEHYVRLIVSLILLQGLLLTRWHGPLIQFNTVAGSSKLTRQRSFDRDGKASWLTV